MITVHINAGEGYDVLIGGGLLGSGERLFGRVEGAVKALAVFDDNVYRLHGERIMTEIRSEGIQAEAFVFPHGEQSKNLQTYGRILETACSLGLDRNDIMIAAGGGITGDLTGFAAATYKRGIRFIQLPTSLLAAVDSSVGGKTGVNLSSGKNQAGCFHQPSLVICDTELMKTLPEREYFCGCAEIIKYAMIGSADLFEQIRTTPVKEQYGQIVSTCVEMKKRYVEEDEFDRGPRMMLNFGHTLGHAVELCSGYTVLHGEAVASGMAAVTRAACRLGICRAGVSEQLDSLLAGYSLPHRIDYPAENLFKAAAGDKKNTGGRTNLIVPETVGTCRIINMPADELKKWIREGCV